jgi:putative endonuclease
LKVRGYTILLLGDRWLIAKRLWAYISGYLAEYKASHYLKKQGLVLLKRNFRSTMGEIDLIMRDRDTLVFIEIKYRDHALLDAIEAVDLYKQRKIIKTAEYFLKNFYPQGLMAARFDVLVYAAHYQKIIWIKQAFIDES